MSCAGSLNTAAGLCGARGYRDGDRDSLRLTGMLSDALYETAHPEGSAAERAAQETGDYQYSQISFSFHEAPLLVPQRLDRL